MANQNSDSGDCDHKTLFFDESGRKIICRGCFLTWHTVDRWGVPDYGYLNYKLNNTVERVCPFTPPKK